MSGIPSLIELRVVTGSNSLTLETYIDGVYPRCAIEVRLAASSGTARNGTLVTRFSQTQQRSSINVPITEGIIASTAADSEVFFSANTVCGNSTFTFRTLRSKYSLIIPVDIATVVSAELPRVARDTWIEHVAEAVPG